MMDNFDFEDNYFPSMDELLVRYEKIRNGEPLQYLEEEDYLNLIEYFDDNENVDNAVEAIGIGLSYFPFSSALLIKKADFEIADKKYLKALRTLELSEIYNRNDINLYILKIDAYLALRDFEKANAAFNEAVSMFKGEEAIDLLLELTDLYDDYDEFDKVFDSLKLILKLDPQNQEALYKICFWTEFLGRNEESIRIHEQIIDQYPYNEIAWFNLAAAYQGLKLYEKAIDKYLYAIAINDKFDYAYRNLGDAYMRLRKYKQAIEVLEKLLELSRSEDVIHEAIGYCYHKLENYDKARMHYVEALNLNPDDTKLSYKIALTYMNERQWHKAEKAMENAIGAKKIFPEMHLAMGECKFQLGAYIDAIHHFGIVVKSRPKNAGAWEALIRSLYFSNNLEEAIVQSENAFEFTDGKYLFLYYKAFALFAMGKQKEAACCLEMALSKDAKAFKKIVDINPLLLQNSAIIELLSRYPVSKKNTRKRN